LLQVSAEVYFIASVEGLQLKIWAQIVELLNFNTTESEILSIMRRDVSHHAVSVADPKRD